MPSVLTRISPLILVSLLSCSLELPGSNTGEVDGDPDAALDADGASPGDDLDADLPDAEADHPDAASDAGQEFDAAPEADAASDAGSDAAAGARCGSALTGDQEQRVRYAAAQVVAPATCQSETQQRTCQASGWSAWSGTFQAASCSVAVYSSCGAVAHGQQEARTRYQAELASSSAGCVAQQQTRTCNDGTFGAWSGSYQFASCAVAVSGSCDIGSTVSCEQGTSCVSAAPSSSGTCLGGTGFDCTANEQCVVTCLSGVCAAQAGPGEACEEPADCAECSNGSAAGCVTGTCRCTNGAQCSDNLQCQNTCVASMCAPADAACDDDLDCTGERKCRRKANVKSCVLPDGDACSANAQCEHVCRAGDCAAAGHNGEVCDENADCTSNLVCRAGSCAQPATLGQACDESADCSPGLACGTLLASPVCLKGFGQPCTLGIECVSGHCSSSGSGSGTFCGF